MTAPASHQIRLSPVTRIEASAYVVPTDGPEADGTLDWSDTTIVIVEARAGNVTGLGYSYADRCAVDLIERVLAPTVMGADVADVPHVRQSMVRRVRNIGRPGLVSTAIAAVDIALWDAKAQLMDVSLAKLLGARRDTVPIYGSGGFLTYSIQRLQKQLAGWADAGIRMVKMKVGADLMRERERVRAAREAIGRDVKLFVDANGACDVQQALEHANAFADDGVTWFEEPVSSDDLEGLRYIRGLAPRGMDIAAGEYGYDTWYFRRMLAADAVDVLQIDATRCGGVTGFMEAASLGDAVNLPLSAHTAPQVHAHVCCALSRARHVEYFYDHARIERLFFDGALQPENGKLRPDLSRPGLGIELKRADVVGFAA